MKAHPVNDQRDQRTAGPCSRPIDLERGQLVNLLQDNNDLSQFTLHDDRARAHRAWHCICMGAITGLSPYIYRP